VIQFSLPILHISFSLSSPSGFLQRWPHLVMVRFLLPNTVSFKPLLLYLLFVTLEITKTVIVLCHLQDFPDEVEACLEHGHAKCIAFNRRGQLLAGNFLLTLLSFSFSLQFLNIKIAFESKRKVILEG